MTDIRDVNQLMAAYIDKHRDENGVPDYKLALQGAMITIIDQRGKIERLESMIEDELDRLSQD